MKGSDGSLIKFQPPRGRLVVDVSSSDFCDSLFTTCTLSSLSINTHPSSSLYFLSFFSLLLSNKSTSFLSVDSLLSSLSDTLSLSSSVQPLFFVLVFHARGPAPPVPTSLDDPITLFLMLTGCSVFYLRMVPKPPSLCVFSARQLSLRACPLPLALALAQRSAPRI